MPSSSSSSSYANPNQTADLPQLTSHCSPTYTETKENKLTSCCYQNIKNKKLIDTHTTLCILVLSFCMS